MSRIVTLDRLLIAASTIWLGILAQWPRLHGDARAFCVTAGVIAVNALVSLSMLTRKRAIVIGLNCTQLVLFGMLSYQVYGTFGPEHYRCDREPRLYDWIEFTVAHLFRAADLLDAFDEYGIPIQTISHRSTPAALVLMLMHLSVDGFLLGLLWRWVKRAWQRPSHETRLQQGRREFGWILGSLTLFVGFAAGNGLSMRDWLLWPLDNLLRLIDVGDVMNLFGWRLHAVEPTYWAKAGSLLFRIAAGIWMARLVILWRLTVFRTWGLGIDDLTKLLDDPDAPVRRNAAIGLAQSGPDAVGAAPALLSALRDVDPAVRVEAARALGQIGPAAWAAVPRLIDAMWLGAGPLRLAVIEALGGIGKDSRSAAESLVHLLKVGDKPTRAAARRALERIAPDVLVHLPTGFGKPLALAPPESKRHAAWDRSFAAAQARRQQEAALRARILDLVQRGYFKEARELEFLRVVLSADGRPIEAAHLALVLLQLVAAGQFGRAKNACGEWAYFATSA